ncbi:MAG: putative RNA-binding protein containing PUA domain Tma20 [Candidatus Methanohalarchaeum thermophilum]|uniref:RNA-binding protein containing PUA domain Tma20 n=1 Tax=Methanohalarchaeum thermophilum TaxID=1903181 RepID=A0A1Q6DXW8_METT1|nr:MAG: putative RNA-binding protein containing PUA domain Tma20 [Candidatus Methanohalarchaeum thermophilum]
MIEIKTRHHLREDKISNLKNYLNGYFDCKLIGDEDKVELAVTDDKKEFIYLNDEPLLFKFGDVFFPNLKGALEFDLNNKFIVVDEGAVPHVVNGADIMAPGVTDVDEEIEEDDLVIIKEENHGKPIAIGKAIEKGKDIKNLEKGKIAKNIHYVGDELWEFINSNSST